MGTKKDAAVGGIISILLNTNSRECFFMHVGSRTIYHRDLILKFVNKSTKRSFNLGPHEFTYSAALRMPTVLSVEAIVS